MQQSPRLCFFSVDFLPLGDRNFLRPVAAPAPRKSVLKHPRLMLEEILIFGAFCANIEAHLLLMKCPIHECLAGSGIRGPYANCCRRFYPNEWGFLDSRHLLYARLSA